ncbi:MAG: sel1 repeat family protein [Lachnospiraceae bacterium]|nr:sel1 repeat family protein [Lachnospiraceae bacterium]
MFSTKGEEAFRKGQECLATPGDNNLRDAMVFFKEAAKEGHVEAIYQVGCLNLWGEPQIAKNFKEAKKCFERCAEAGLSRSKYFLGEFYLDGLGVEKDEKKAFDMFEEAFNEGVSGAANILCHCHWEGKGTEKNIDKAKQYNDIARKLGLPGAEADFFRLASRKDLFDDLFGKKGSEDKKEGEENKPKEQ